MMVTKFPFTWTSSPVKLKVKCFLIEKFLPQVIIGLLQTFAGIQSINYQSIYIIIKCYFLFAPMFRDSKVFCCCCCWKREKSKNRGELRCFKGNHFHLHWKKMFKGTGMNGDSTWKGTVYRSRVFRGRKRDRFVAMLKWFLVEYLSEMLLVWSQNRSSSTAEVSYWNWKIAELSLAESK